MAYRRRYRMRRRIVRRRGYPVRRRRGYRRGRLRVGYRM